MFSIAIASPIPEFTLVFGGSIGIVILLGMLIISTLALTYGVISNERKSSKSDSAYTDDSESDISGVLSIQR